MPPEVPLLYKIVLAILGFLFCHINLIIVLSRSVKTFDGTLMGIALNLQIAFNRIAIFTMLILPIQEQGRSSHFLVSSSISFFKNLKFLSNWSFTSLQTCAATVEISVVVSQETGSQPPSGPSNSTLGNISKRCPIIPQKHLFNYVLSSTICNSQNLETTQVPLNRRMVKEGVKHIYIRVLLSGKKQ